MAEEAKHDIKDEKSSRPLNEDDIALLKIYVISPPLPPYKP